MSLDSSLSDYFLVVLQDGTEVAICNQEDCKFKARKVPNITGNHTFTGNLGAHLKRKHPEHYVFLQAKRTLHPQLEFKQLWIRLLVSQLKSPRKNSTRLNYLEMKLKVQLLRP